MTLDWLIIGGGIHGVHIAARLLDEAGVSREQLRIVDPGPRLLDRWRSCTETTGMTHLHSPSVHHLGTDHGALRRFAGKRKNRMPRRFVPPFERPSIGLFNEHCDQIEKKLGLAELHIRDRAVRCSTGCDDVAVELAGGEELRTRHLVLAMGCSDQPYRPAWASVDAARIQHVFEPGFNDWPTSPETVMVVGGGISAAHVVLRLLAEGHEVHHVSRHPIRQHQFDSDPGWLGVTYASRFIRTDDLEERRAMITEARHKGSVPPDLNRALRRALSRNQLQWHEGQVAELDTQHDGLRITLENGTELSVDRVLLATGFKTDRPGGTMIDELIESASLPCAQCGYPIVDSALRWHPQIHVTGPLAELELGPVSRNIAGARWAGDRIVDAVRSGTIMCPHEAHLANS